MFPLCVQPLYGAALWRLDQAALYRAMKAKGTLHHFHIPHQTTSVQFKILGNQTNTI